MKKYIINIISFSAVISIVALLLFRFFIPQYYLAIFPAVILYFMAIAIFIYHIVNKGKDKNNQRFNIIYMGTIGLRMFLYLIFVMIYIFLDRPNAVNFVIQFMILYILYTVFEKYFLLKTINSTNNK